MSPNFLKFIQKSTRHFGIVICLKNEKPEPTYMTSFLGIPNTKKSIENSIKFYLYFGLKPLAKENTIYKLIHTYPSVGYPVKQS